MLFGNEQKQDPRVSTYLIEHQKRQKTSHGYCGCRYCLANEMSYKHYPSIIGIKLILANENLGKVVDMSADEHCESKHQLWCTV